MQGARNFMQHSNSVPSLTNMQQASQLLQRASVLTLVLC
jgi:hypothetical protein